jgi:PadR family transcriptional regulator, regulatory protein PadR
MLEALNRGAAAQARLERSADMSGWTETDHFLCAGLIRLHILGRAAGGPVFGLELMESLAEKGLRLSPGTLYPILHGFEARGLLKSTSQRSGKHARTVYYATPAGMESASSRKAKGS